MIDQLRSGSGSRACVHSSIPMGGVAAGDLSLANVQDHDLAAELRRHLGRNREAFRLDSDPSAATKIRSNIVDPSIPVGRSPPPWAGPTRRRLSRSKPSTGERSSTWSEVPGRE